MAKGAGLLDNRDKRLNYFAGNDIIEYVLKHKEVEALHQRIEAIEQRLSDHGWK
jgi:hypothetical protein